MAAANAQIGVARAAFFPTLTLGGAAVFVTTHGQLFQTGTASGVSARSSAVLTLFDGGRRTSQVKCLAPNMRNWRPVIAIPS